MRESVVHVELNFQLVLCQIKYSKCTVLLRFQDPYVDQKLTAVAHDWRADRQLTPVCVG